MKKQKVDEMLVAPASFQQIELISRISQFPESAERYNGILIRQLDGPLDVAALIGALEDLIKRHPSLRTTMNMEDILPRQEIHERQLLPVTVSEMKATSVLEVTRKTFASWLSGAEVMSGAPLFNAEIVKLDDTHLLILNLHHLVSDAWSDAVMFRDLAEFYSARIEARLPNLPKLTLTYAEFAKRQHENWAASRSQEIEFWKSQLDSYPGSVMWPRPAEMPDDPYVWQFTTRELDAQTTLDIRFAAREWQVFPFLILIAATVMAIGDMTGQYDILVGSNMSNREAFEKRALIGYFTNTRLMRIRLAPDLSMDAATAIVREQWLVGDVFRTVPTDPLLAELGISLQALKIDPLELPPTFTSLGGLKLPGIKVSAVSFGLGQLRDRRDINVIWKPSPDSFHIEIRHRLAAIDRAMAAAIAERAITILAQMNKKELSA